VLDEFEMLKVYVAYNINGRRVDAFPSSRLALEAAEPIYEELPGWQEETSHCRRFDDLPANAQRYVRRIEDLIGAPAALVSVGPERDQAIIVDPIL
ncbi:MAG: adenylosuccinate synthetase, partial [Chloroflexi bacterium]|nr:adenylosuccinate synthetase [Chloroflexota bacterium]